MKGLIDGSYNGSMVSVPFILFSIRPIFNYAKKLVKRVTDKSFSKSGKIQKCGAWGLLLFVAIPLPGTGVWSGSLAAALLNMRFKWAFPAMFVGNLIAGILIMGLSNGVIEVIGV